jgi:radical SAM protein with 4Fe4S-binding SPASM domain
MKFQKIYIEISNICNLQCSFCPVVERDKSIMPPDLFNKILSEVSPYTKEICLHLMGEPLAHPKFKEILEICDAQFKLSNVPVNLTTNGVFLNKHIEQLISSPSIKQINFSIHSFKDNYKDKNITPYLDEILNFSERLRIERPLVYVNYRLWNIFEETLQNEENSSIINYMSHFFSQELNLKIDVSSIKSKKIIDRIYFHFDSRFTWPSMSLDKISMTGTCHALKGHIGIHANGTVVPCCLDKEAIIDLGNLQNIPLSTILDSVRAKKMKEGFSQKKLVEELCQRCPYITRFQ